MRLRAAYLFRASSFFKSGIAGKVAAMSPFDGSKRICVHAHVLSGAPHLAPSITKSDSDCAGVLSGLDECRQFKLPLSNSEFDYVTIVQIKLLGHAGSNCRIVSPGNLGDWIRKFL